MYTPAFQFPRKNWRNDAIAVRMAGADELHIHPRDENGRETLAASDVGRALLAIRASVAEVPIGIGTGTWIEPGGRERHPLIEEWIVLPDYCSANLNEDGAVEVIDLLSRKGIGVEAGLWTEGDAERFVSEVDAGKCLRVFIEMTADDPAAALREADRAMEILARAKCVLLVLLHGEGGSVWSCVDKRQDWVYLRGLALKTAGRFQTVQWSKLTHHLSTPRVSISRGVDSSEYLIGEILNLPMAKARGF